MVRTGPKGPTNQEPCLRVFRRRLTAAMRLRGMDADDLAEAVDVTRPAVTYWTTGRRLPYAVMLVRVCRVLGVSADWLVGLSNNPRPPWVDPLGREPLYASEADVAERAVALGVSADWLLGLTDDPTQRWVLEDGAP